MARRPVRHRGGRANTGVQLAQILGLVLVLVIILLFRDKIGLGAGQFFGSFDSEDVVLPEEASPPADPAASSPPDGAPAD